MLENKFQANLIKELKERFPGCIVMKNDPTYIQGIPDLLVLHKDNMYVNDAIGFKMTPEQILYYSDNCFGTADAILFRNNFFRIHDLKTGKIPAHMEQLEIYAALFCLEYKVKPGDIEMELRIYQNNEILYHNPTAEDIVPIMDRIITFDKVIKKIREQEG